MSTVDGILCCFGKTSSDPAPDGDGLKPTGSNLTSSTTEETTASSTSASRAESPTLFSEPMLDINPPVQEDEEQLQKLLLKLHVANAISNNNSSIIGEDSEAAVLNPPNDVTDTLLEVTSSYLLAYKETTRKLKELSVATHACTSMVEEGTAPTPNKAKMEELKESLSDPTLSPIDRKRIKNKLKKRRNQENKRAASRSPKNDHDEPVAPEKQEAEGIEVVSEFSKTSPQKDEPNAVKEDNEKEYKEALSNAIMNIVSEGSIKAEKKKAKKRPPGKKRPPRQTKETEKEEVMKSPSASIASRCAWLAEKEQNHRRSSIRDEDIPKATTVRKKWAVVAPPPGIAITSDASRRRASAVQLKEQQEKMDNSSSSNSTDCKTTAVVDVSKSLYCGSWEEEKQPETRSGSKVEATEEESTTSTETPGVSEAPTTISPDATETTTTQKFHSKLLEHLPVLLCVMAVLGTVMAGLAASSFVANSQHTNGRTINFIRDTTTFVDGLCSPVPPNQLLDHTWTETDAANDGNIGAQLVSVAPWWVPGEASKSLIFPYLCGPDRVQTKVSWTRTTYKGTAPLHDLTFRDVNNNNKGKTLLAIKRVRAAQLRHSSLAVTTKSGQTETMQAPWATK